MMSKRNKGMSMPEVLVALAVFMIMLIPLVSSLITGIRTTTTAKETQSRNEYASNLMEVVKEMPISALDSKTTSYFTQMGVDDAVEIKDKVVENTDPGNNQYDVYTIKGSTKIGVEQSTYQYLIQVSNKAYTEAKENGTLTSNPNEATSGLVQNLDQTKEALLSAPLSNYDNIAYSTLLMKKMKKLQTKYEDKDEADHAGDERYLPSAPDWSKLLDEFKEDRGKREIKISIKRDEAAEEPYQVSCSITYSDTCSVPSKFTTPSTTIGNDVGEISFNVYSKSFKELPDVYLMYNVGVYNARYTSDTITIDVSGTGASAIEKVNVFLVATAANYSDDMEASIRSSTSELKSTMLQYLDQETIDTLHRKAAVTTELRRNIAVNVGVSSTTSDEWKNKLYVYHNFDQLSDDAKPAELTLTEPVKTEGMSDEEYNQAVAEYKSVVKEYNKKYALWANSMPSVTFGVPNVDKMDQALQDIRGLYEVRIWMRKGDQEPDTTKQPILTGTKGGGEID